MPQPSLHELFEQYKQDNTDAESLAGYRSVCSQIEDIRNGRQQLTADFVKQVWTARDFGPARINNGILGESEFSNAREELTALTRKIIDAPTPATLNEVYDELSRLRTQGVISWRPITITNRLVAACVPTKYTSAVYVEFYSPLYRFLRSHYGLTITSGNWAESDSSMRSALVAYGLSNHDPYLLNKFAWDLSKQVRNMPLPEEDIPANGERTEEEGSSEARFPMPTALNTIYYGPPGTGKTYTVLGMLKENFVTRYVQETEAQWIERLAQEEGSIWRNIVAAALQDLGGKATVPQLRKHPLIDAKFRCMDGQRTSRARLWSTLQTYSPEESTTVNLARKRPPALFDKLSDGSSTWTLLPEWEEDASDAVMLLQRYQQGRPAAEHEEKRYDCITFHQSYSYEEFVEGIRPVLTDDETDGSDLEYALRDGVFKRFCETVRANPEKKYALLVDEVNRGNISKIFGELITLIEDSKRDGAVDAMSVTLPYSGKKFSVPSNLYIIGTMNTADRSLAFMDTALRRRFSFERLDPNPALLEGVSVEGINLEKLLSVLNERIEALYDKDHTIGHSYFMHVREMGELREVFLKKILPLLEEYFFDDWEKIRLVLGDNQKQANNLGQYCLLTSDDRNERLFGSNTGSVQLLPRLRYNENAMLNPKTFIGIYDLAAAQE